MSNPAIFDSIKAAIVFMVANGVSPAQLEQTGLAQELILVSLSNQPNLGSNHSPFFARPIDKWRHDRPSTAADRSSGPKISELSPPKRPRTKKSKRKDLDRPVNMTEPTLLTSPTLYEDRSQSAPTLSDRCQPSGKWFVQDKPPSAYIFELSDDDCTDAVHTKPITASSVETLSHQAALKRKLELAEKELELLRLKQKMALLMEKKRAQMSNDKDPRRRESSADEEPATALSSVESASNQELEETEKGKIDDSAVSSMDFHRKHELQALCSEKKKKEERCKQLRDSIMSLTAQLDAAQKELTALTSTVAEMNAYIESLH